MTIIDLHINYGFHSQSAMKASGGSQGRGDPGGWFSVHYVQMGSQCRCLGDPKNVEQEDYLKGLICK